MITIKLTLNKIKKDMKFRKYGNILLNQYIDE